MDLKKLTLLAVIGLVLLRLVIYQNFLLGREAYFYSDDAIYATLSKRFLVGDFWQAFHPYWSPGFPMATIPFYLISGSWEKAQFLVSATSATILIIVLFLFYRKYSLLLSFIVAFITAFSISLQKLVTSGGMTEPLYILWLWLGIFFGWLALTSFKWHMFVWAGFFFGLAYLTRNEVFAIFALYIFILGLRFIFLKKNFKKKLRFWVPKVGILIFIFLLVNIPYIGFQSLQLGRLTFSGKYAFVGTGPYYALEKDRMTTMAQDIWSTDYPDYSSPYFDPKRATNYIITNFKNKALIQNARKSFFESLTLYKSENMDSFFVGFGLYMAFAGFAFGVLSRKFRLLTLYFALLWMAGLVWVSFFMGPTYRYLVYAFPFFFYLQALAIYAAGLLTLFLARLIFTTRRADKVSGLSMIILPGFLLGNFFMKNVDPSFFTSIKFTGGSKDHKMIGDFIKSQNIDVLGGRIEAIPFYANAKLVYMPSSPPNDIVLYMKVWGVEYLLVRPPEVGYDFVAPIANPEFKHPDLSLFKRFKDGSLIWRIKLTEEEKKNNPRLVRERKLLHDLQ